MGRLVDGKWVKTSIITSDNSGDYARIPRSFRSFISKENSVFQPESQRYHLYVSYACPWATRTLIYRELKNLVPHISVSVVHPDMLEEGWVFDDSFSGSTKDPLFHFKYLREIYQKADPNVNTSVTVPVLWDKKTNTIVNNESSEIIRMFNSSFNDLTGNTDDYYPEPLREKIDLINEKIYETVNNGVYRSGFAVTQEAYNEAVFKLFQTLDELDSLLNEYPYLAGEQLTEADLRLVPTLLRFDCVYYSHFKCNKKRIKDYKNLHSYMIRLFEIPAIKNTNHFDHIKRHYFYSHESINPARIVPLGPIDIF